MILTACVYPITGLLLLCTLSGLTVVSSDDLKATARNSDISNLAKSATSSGRRPVAGGNDVFTSSFLVRFRRSVDNDYAHAVAQKYGFDNLGAVSMALLTFYCQSNSGRNHKKLMLHLSGWV